MNEKDLKSLARNIKAVVFDLDGTLLNSKKVIEKESLEAIFALNKKGIFTTICSGRVYSMLEFYIKMLNINGLVISSNGASVDNSNNNENVYNKKIEQSVAKKVVSFCLENNIECSSLSRECCVFSQSSIRKERFVQYNEIARQNNFRTLKVDYYNDDLSNVFSCEKLLVYEVNDKKRAIAFDFLNSQASLDCTVSEPNLIDISAKNVNKGVGVVAFAEKMSIDIKEVAVFGDYLNDLSMFNVAGFRVAMGNSCDEIKSIADFVTKSNDDGGIAYAINKLFL